MDKEILANQLKEWRHYLHMNAEGVFEEVKTAAFVADKLREMGLEVHQKIGKTGVVASLSAGAGQEVIGLRADMDAINMVECSGVLYQSLNEGRMHACGHDGHMATLLGAVAMMKDSLFERFPVDELYGFHNMPQLPGNTISTCVGGIMAGEDNLVITITGRGGHASQPHLGKDPLVIAAEIILALQTIVSRNLNPQKAAVISCTEIHTDGIRNAIPTTVVIKGDTRSFDPDIQIMIESRMKRICEGICRMNDAACSFVYTHEFAPTYNWKSCTEFAVAAAKKAVGEERVDESCEPVMGSEDFGAFIKEIPGCFVFLGSGKTIDCKDEIPLHNHRYDYNDEVLVTGAEYLAELISTRLPQKD